MSGIEEEEAARLLCDKSDPTRLGWREIRDGYGSNSNFFQTHGLKPWKSEDQVEALEISRQLKADGNTVQQTSNSKKVASKK